MTKRHVYAVNVADLNPFFVAYDIGKLDIRIVCLIVGMVLGGLYLMWYYGSFRRRRMNKRKVAPDSDKGSPLHSQPKHIKSVTGRVYPDTQYENRETT